MKIIFISIILLFILSYNVFSQYQNIEIATQYERSETSIAINPNNTNQMVAGSNSFYQGNYVCSYYCSTDGGLNWTNGFLTSPLGNIYCDPTITVDNLGNFYYVADANGPNFPPTLNKLFCSKTTNCGVNWIIDTFANCYPKMADMPTVCVDLSGSSIYQNNICVVYSLADTIHTSYSHNDSSNAYFCRSTDHGLTFSVPYRLSKKAGRGICFCNNYLEGCVVCTGPQGQVYTAWVDSAGLIFDRSTDGGQTWLDSNIFVSTLVGGWASMNGYDCGYTGTPWIDCDISTGPFKGNIYLSWTDSRSGFSRKDVWLVKSSDMGNTWSPPLRVNDDSANASNKSHFFTHLAVDQSNGNLYCAFYDNRNYYSNYYLDLYLARSTDGGNTFVNVKVNTNQFHICNIPYGDYIGLVARNNIVRPVWTENVNNTNTIWTAIVDTFIIGIKPISNEIPASFRLFQNYPNPFNPSTKIKFDVANSPLYGAPSGSRGTGKFVSIKIYDILGREVATLVNEKLNAGTYEVEWNASNFPSGVYFYKLETIGFSQTKKLVLIK